MLKWAKIADSIGLSVYFSLTNSKAAATLLGTFSQLAGVYPKMLKVKNGIKLEGKVVAAKGNIIILNSEDMFYSLNAHEMVGREVEINN